MLIAKLHHYTHAEVSINGDLSWVIFPRPGVNVRNIVIQSSPTAREKISVEIGDVMIGLKWLSLFTGKWTPDWLKVRFVTVNGMKNQLPLTSANVSASQPAVSPQPINVASPHQTLAVMAVPQMVIPQKRSKSSNNFKKISGIDIKVSDLNINWQQGKKIYRVNHVKIRASHVGFNQPFPFSISWIIAKRHFIRVGLSGQLSWNDAHQILTYQQSRLQIQTFYKGKLRRFLLQGDLQLNLPQQTFMGSKLQIEIDHLLMQGQFVTTLYSQPKRVALQSHFYQSALLPEKNKQSSDLSNIDIDLTVNLEKKKDLLKFIHGRIQFYLGSAFIYQMGLNEFLQAQILKINKTDLENDEVHLHSFSGQANIDAGIIHLHDIWLVGANKKMQGKGTIDFIQHKINYSFTEHQH